MCPGVTAMLGLHTAAAGDVAGDTDLGGLAPLRPSAAADAARRRSSMPSAAGALDSGEADPASPSEEAPADAADGEGGWDCAGGASDGEDDGYAAGDAEDAERRMQVPTPGTTAGRRSPPVLQSRGLGGGPCRRKGSWVIRGGRGAHRAAGAARRSWATRRRRRARRSAAAGRRFPGRRVRRVRWSWARCRAQAPLSASLDPPRNLPYGDWAEWAVCAAIKLFKLFSYRTVIKPPCLCGCGADWPAGWTDGGWWEPKRGKKGSGLRLGTPARAHTTQYT